MASWFEVLMHLMALGAFRPSHTRACATGEPTVLMHLMALGAFRPSTMSLVRLCTSRLNAPYGARCFPTNREFVLAGLAQPVLMHLMALGAF